MISKLRFATGAAALAAGAWFLTATAAPVALPPAAAKAVTAADVADLQKRAETIAAAPEKNKGAIRTAKAIALMLGVYGDAATKSQATAVAAALDKKDYKGAAELAKGLSAPKGGPAAKFEYGLEDVMSPFRIAKSGGLNIEKDIRDAIRDGKIDGKAAELIGARSAALASYTEEMPNDKAKSNPAMTARWKKYAKDMAAAGKDLATQGAKGDAKALVGTLKKLNAACTNCHSDFRDE